MRVRDILIEHKQGYYRPGKFESGNIHFVRISDITDNAFLDTSSTPKISITSDVINNFSVKKDDFLFARTGGAGRFCLIKEDVHGIFASYLIRFRFNKKYDSDFLRYFFMSDSFQFELNSKIHGGVNQNVHAENIKDCLVPEFLLSEQKRIVSILDETFAAIDKAKANAEKNLQNAKDLFESYLQSVFTNSGEDWDEMPFGECFRLKSGDGLVSKHMNKGVYPVFGGNGIAGMHDNYNLEGDNVIIGRVGALCGNARNIKENIWLTDNAFKIIDFNYKFDNSFLTYLLNFKNLRKLARQAAQPVISNSSLKDLLLQFPKSIRKQQEIVKRFDKLSSETKKLESIYQQKLKDLEELKKSILQKAFSGEL